MFNEKKETNSGRMPDFSSRDGVAVWTNQDKNGKPYLTIKIALLGISVNAFSTEKQKEEGI